MYYTEEHISKYNTCCCARLVFLHEVNTPKHVPSRGRFSYEWFISAIPCKRDSVIFESSIIVKNSVKLPVMDTQKHMYLYFFTNFIFVTLPLRDLFMLGS